ncbi:sulfite exporter TauE/SafE family protein [bacterium]|nr:sulfite exporter TauE/SafE family protein [bacterium]
MAKAGVTGTALMIVPIMAMVFGGKPSTGIVLPMLIIADLLAVKHYHRHANWKYILKVTPWTLVGIIAALVVGNAISGELFKRILSVSILCGIVLMVWRDIRKPVAIPDNWWFAMILGLAGGFATMFANAAGPILSLYLLSMRIPKMVFISTAAWFFLLVNLFKVPLHIYVWKTITLKTLSFNLVLAPFIILGVLMGIQIVKWFPEKLYRILVIVTAVIPVFFLFQ